MKLKRKYSQKKTNWYAEYCINKILYKHTDFEEDENKYFT